MVARHDSGIYAGGSLRDRDRVGISTARCKTLDLVDGILPLLELYPESSYVKPEFIQNTVEIATRVCYSLAKLDSHVRGLVSELDARCRRLGIHLGSSTPSLISPSDHSRASASRTSSCTISW